MLVQIPSLRTIYAMVRIYRNLGKGQVSKNFFVGNTAIFVCQTESLTDLIHKASGHHVLMSWEKTQKMSFQNVKKCYTRKV